MASFRPTVLLLVLGLGALAGLGATPASAQFLAGVPPELIERAMPEADRFDPIEGDPPVMRGWDVAPDGSERFVGFVYHTSDLPPEEYGYSGTIQAVVGVTPDGTLTGVRVVDYQESYMRQMGDFLRRRGFQEQFTGKYIGDPFRVWGDVDGMSRVTISVRALSRGVRDSARRVAQAYAAGAFAEPEEPATDPVGMSWFDLNRNGIVERFVVTEPGQGSAGISLAHIGSDREGEYYYGRVQYESALRSMARRDGAEHLMLYAVDGARLRLFLREGWSIVQAGDTLAIDPQMIVPLGMPSGGIVSGEATMVGVMLVKRPLDLRRPFTFVYDLGELGVHTVEYRTPDARLLIAEEAAAAAEQAAAAAETEAAAAEGLAEAGSVAADAGRGRAGGVEESVSTVGPGTVPAAAPPRPGPSEADPGPVGTATPADAARAPDAAAIAVPEAPPRVAPVQEFDFIVLEEPGALERFVAETDWTRVVTMLAVLALAAWAFASKSARARWVSLTATLVVLGFVDGGFLSVSHVTSGIWTGVGVYVRDVPLLLIAGFTVVTTLVWGRVFCGFLCPFGALQDVLERIVPRSLQRALPRPVHDRAVWLKYAILGVIVIPALLGSHVSLYQYFEPFGTVFFLSSSLLFWSIAISILLASAVVPRFYCRYACPLGAALAVGSLVAPRRIGRVEQCEHCKVCEQRCPTGAIRAHRIDFKECVRCNDCEIQLLERRGVCRHDMDAIRPRLVQIAARRAASPATGAVVADGA